MYVVCSFVKVYMYRTGVGKYRPVPRSQCNSVVHEGRCVVSEMDCA